MSLLVLDNLDWISKKTSEKEQSFELKVELNDNIESDYNIWKSTTLPLIITNCLRKGNFSVYGDKCKEETIFSYNKLNVSIRQGSADYYDIAVLPERVKILC